MPAVRAIVIDRTDRWRVARCPACRNRVDFRIHSNQVAEDGCEIWAECQCGYDPTFDRSGERVESVMGVIEEPDVTNALNVWTQLVQEDRKAGRPVTMHGKPFVIGQARGVDG